jgi:isopenicillin-N epimerase
MKDIFLLSPDVTFLNHGSYGACPKPVFEKYQFWQRELERQPVQFMVEKVYKHLETARKKLGELVGCNSGDLIFIPNPTTGFTTMTNCLSLKPGDEILSTDHEYGALIRGWNTISKKTGARFIQREIPLPCTTHEDFTEYFCEGITKKTKVIFISHITSSTAMIFPIHEICRRARERGILTIIDGAHVPGHIPINILDIDPDVYIGACHKWLCAPKGSSFLYVRKTFQDNIAPLITSWGDEGCDPSDSSFLLENQWQGTRDMSAFLSVTEAIEFQQKNNWSDLTKKCRWLVRETRSRLDEYFDLMHICPNTEEWIGQMASVEIKIDDPIKIKNDLLKNYSIEVPIFEWKGKTLLRYSINVYNDQQDIDLLIYALRETSSLII